MVGKSWIWQRRNEPIQNSQTVANARHFKPKNVKNVNPDRPGATTNNQQPTTNNQQPTRTLVDGGYLMADHALGVQPPPINYQPSTNP